MEFKNKSLRLPDLRAQMRCLSLSGYRNKLPLVRSKIFARSPLPLLQRFRRSLELLLIAAVPTLAAACAVPDPSNASADSAADARVREVSFQHDDCKADGGSKTVDVNGDGRPDIVHVMKDGKEACRMVDLNFDGLTDVFIYYDEKGQERRREADFDRDGRPDQVSIFQNGQLIENQRETNFDDKIDTWDYYQGGVLAKRERDSDGDAIIDQWWTFYDPARPKCATVASDRNADGKPDADSQVDLCGTGYVSPGTTPGVAPGAPTAAASGSATPVTTPAPPVVAGPGAPTPGPSTSSQPAPAPAPTSSAPAPQ